MKKNKTQRTAAIVETIEANEVGTMSPEVTVTESKPSLGRPVNPNSDRQKRLAEQKNKTVGGYKPLGRPVVMDSKRQQKLHEITTKKLSGMEVKKGRPAMTEEQKEAARQKRIEAYKQFLEANKDNAELIASTPAPSGYEPVKEEIVVKAEIAE